MASTELGTGWDHITSALQYPQRENFREVISENQAVFEGIDIKILSQWYLVHLEAVVRTQITPSFWKILNKVKYHPKTTRMRRISACQCLTAAVEFAHRTLHSTNEVLSELERLTDEPRSSLSSRFSSTLWTLLFAPDSGQLREMIQVVFRYAFRVYAANQEEDVCGEGGSGEESEGEGGRPPRPAKPGDAAVLQRWQGVCQQLRELRWMAYVEEVVSEMLQLEVERKVRRRCAGTLDVRTLPPLLRWLRRTALPWMDIALGYAAATADDGAGSEDGGSDAGMGDGAEGEEAEVVVAVAVAGGGSGRRRRQRQRHSWLRFYLLESVCRLRAREVFEMITEFPDR